MKGFKKIAIGSIMLIVLMIELVAGSLIINKLSLNTGQQCIVAMFGVLIGMFKLFMYWLLIVTGFKDLKILD